MTASQLTAITPGTSLYSDVDLNEWEYDCPSARRTDFHWLDNHEGGQESFHAIEMLTNFHLTRDDALRSLIVRKEAELTELKSQLPVGA